jgi:hypothetical protein
MPKSFIVMMAVGGPVAELVDDLSCANSHTGLVRGFSFAPPFNPSKSSSDSFHLL